MVRLYCRLDKRAENCSINSYTFRKKRPTKEWSLQPHRRQKRHFTEIHDKTRTLRWRKKQRLIRDSSARKVSFKIIAVRNHPTTKSPTCFANEASRNILAPLFLELRRVLKYSFVRCPDHVTRAQSSRRLTAGVRFSKVGPVSHCILNTDVPTPWNFAGSIVGFRETHPWTRLDALLSGALLFNAGLS